MQNLIAENRNAQHELHRVSGQLGHHVLLDDLLDDERNTNHHGGFHFAEGLNDDFRAGEASEVVHVNTMNELKEELESHAIHVCHGKHRDDTRAGRCLVSQSFLGKLAVAPQSAERKEHTFGVGSRSAGVVDHGQCFAVGGGAIVNVLGAEKFGIALAIKFVQALAGFGERLFSAHQQHKVGDMNDAFELGHGFCIESGPNHVAGKEKTRVRVVDDIVYLLGFELVEDGYHDGTIGHCGQKGDSPVCTVASADGNLVSRLNPGRFKQNVKLLNFASHILVLEGHALIVGEGIEIPMINDALLNQTDKVFVMVFHEE